MDTVSKKPPPLKCETLLREMPDLLVRIVGNPQTPIQSIRGPDEAEIGCAVFCSQPRLIKQSVASPAAVLVVPETFDPTTLPPELSGPAASKTFLFATNVEQALAAAVQKWFLKSPYRDSSFPGRHPTAVIHSSVKIGREVHIGPHVVIGENARLGNHVFIGANTVIEANTDIGDDTVVHPLVYIGHHTVLGKRCEIMPNTTIGKEGFGYARRKNNQHDRIPHQGRVVIEDDVHVGSNCSIDRGTFGETRIGEGTKIDNQVHLAHNCKVGTNGILTARFAVAGSTSIGRNFVAGGNSSSTGHIKIGDNVHLAALSAATKDITEPGQYGGFPLLKLQTYLKVKAAIAQLPTIRKHVKMLMKKNFPDLDLSTKESTED